MHAIKVGVFTSALCLSFSPAAFAADVSPANSYGYYIGLFGGYEVESDLSFDVIQSVDRDDSAYLGLVAGAQVTDMVRAEVEVSYRFDSEGEGCPSNSKCINGDFDASSLAILGNVWLDLPVDMPVRPTLAVGWGLQIRWWICQLAMAQIGGWPTSSAAEYVTMPVKASRLMRATAISALMSTMMHLHIHPEVPPEQTAPMCCS